MVNAHVCVSPQRVLLCKKLSTLSAAVSDAFVLGSYMITEVLVIAVRLPTLITLKRPSL